VDGFTDDVIAVEVAAGFTVCVRAEDVLSLKLLFPP
jgi:hypothetical protein